MDERVEAFLADYYRRLAADGGALSGLTQIVEETRKGRASHGRPFKLRLMSFTREASSRRAHYCISAWVRCRSRRRLMPERSRRVAMVMRLQTRSRWCAARNNTVQTLLSRQALFPWLSKLLLAVVVQCPSMIARIAASMAELGATRADIADAFGVSTRTILLWCLYTLGLYTL
jgi:hypothetical protein